MEITEKTTIKEIFQHLFDLFADSEIPAFFDGTYLQYTKRGSSGGIIYFTFFENGILVESVYIYYFQDMENKSFNVQKITNIINTIKNDNS